jgi:hypothetical protein
VAGAFNVGTYMLHIAVVTLSWSLLRFKVNVTAACQPRPTPTRITTQSFIHQNTLFSVASER